MPKALGGREPSRTALATYWRTGKTSINGEEYDKSISFRSAWESATASFAAGGFDYFDATVAVVINDASQTGTTAATCQAVLTLWSNTGKLFTSLPQHLGDVPLKLHVALNGANALMLSYRFNDRDGVSKAIWWGNARLSKLAPQISGTEEAGPIAGAASTKQEPPRRLPAVNPTAPTGSEHPALTEQASVPAIAMEIGGLDLNQLQVLDRLIHKRIKVLEQNRK